MSAERRFSFERTPEETTTGWWVLIVAGLIIPCGLLACVAGWWWVRFRPDDQPAPNPAPTLVTWATFTPIPTPLPTSTPIPTRTPSPTLSPTLPPPSPTPTALLPTATPTVGPGWGSVRLRTTDGMEQVYVGSGSFQMGSVDDDLLAYNNERPPHEVTLPSFWLDRTEVTNDQFRQCVAGGDCEPPTECDWGEPTYNKAGLGDHPVVCVDWPSAQAYCAWAGGRLPTEAEWEYAARGPQNRLYPWGDLFDSGRLNYCDKSCALDHHDPGYYDGYARTAPVGHYPAGAGFWAGWDMAGNVWEWTQDWYDLDYYLNSPIDDPPGPAEGVARSMRGGSWMEGEADLRAAIRLGRKPEFRMANVGFRCVD